MLMLDTDHLTLLERGGSPSLALQMRLAQVPREEITSSIVTYEEQMRGWLARTAQANTPAKMIDAYSYLMTHVETFREIPLLPFNEAAVAQFDRLRRMQIRIATMDIKIAAIALANDALLLTRNLRDFGKIPELRAED